jgi:hypothetical protein
VPSNDALKLTAPLGGAQRRIEGDISCCLSLCTGAAAERGVIQTTRPQSNWMPNEGLVAGYLAHADAVAHDREDTHFWAYVRLHQFAEQEPEAAWPLIVEVVKGATDDQMLGYVSADILESVICVHGEALIERIEVLAHADNQFRRALANVWVTLRDDVQARLDALVGRELGAG